MSFQEQISKLQTIYRLQHDLSNTISGAEFADEKGQLSEDEKNQLLMQKEEYRQRGAEEIVLREKIQTEFPEEYTQYLKGLHARLTTIQTYLNTLKDEIEFKHSLNKTLCKNLLSDLSKFIRNQKTQYDLNWLFDVSVRLTEEYKTLL